MSSKSLERWRADAAALGMRHIQQATETMNASEDWSAVLATLQAGDPAAWGWVPSEPDLGGTLTPNTLFELVTGIRPTAAIGDCVEAVADAYEETVAQHYGAAVEQRLVELCGVTR